MAIDDALQDMVEEEEREKLRRPVLINRIKNRTPPSIPTPTPKYAEYFFFAYIGLAFTVLPFILGRNIYHRITADKIVCAGDRTTLYGFDNDKDGEIDEIKEYFSVAGARMAAPMMITYTAEDKKFESLAKVLNE